jgi:hypothetical protein
MAGSVILNSLAARLGRALLVVSAVATLAPPAHAEGASEQAAKRRAFFGELHLHTELSLDAWGYGTKLMPQDAYKFGKGETVMVPAAQVAAEQGISGDNAVAAKRAWPLDFMAVERLRQERSRSQDSRESLGCPKHEGRLTPPRRRTAPRVHA